MTPGQLSLLKGLVDRIASEFVIPHPQADRKEYARSIILALGMHSDKERSALL